MYICELDQIRRWESFSQPPHHSTKHVGPWNLSMNAVLTEKGEKGANNACGFKFEDRVTLHMPVVTELPFPCLHVPDWV